MILFSLQILQWGTLIPMILSGVIAVLLTMRFVWREKQDGLRHVAMIFVGFADMGPIMVLFDVLYTFIGMGDTFILEKDGDSQWEMQNGLILNIVVFVLLVTLQISDCF